MNKRKNKNKNKRKSNINTKANNNTDINISGSINNNNKEKVKSYFAKYKKVIGLLSVLLFPLLTYIAITEYLCKSNATKQDIKDQTKMIVDTVLNSLPDKNLLIKEIKELKLSYRKEDNLMLPGFDISLFMKLHKVANKRKQFIFDKGESLTINRVSIFVDEESNLCYKITDDYSESYILKLTEKEYPDLFKSTLFLYFEYGKGADKSYMKMFVNEKVITSQVNNYAISFDKNKFMEKDNMVIGSDIEGKNGGNFIMHILSISKVNLSEVKKRDFANISKKLVSKLLGSSDDKTNKMFINGKLLYY